MLRTTMRRWNEANNLPSINVRLLAVHVSVTILLLLILAHPNNTHYCLGVQLRVILVPALYLDVTLPIYACRLGLPKGIIII